MGDMFRSEKMTLCQIFLQPEAAYKTVTELGEIGCVEFRDMNTDMIAFQRKFVSEVRRCNELERKMTYLSNEVTKDDIKMRDIVEDFPPAPSPKDVAEMEAILEKAEIEVQEFSQNVVKLKLNFLELIELSLVLEKTQVFFDEQEVANMEQSDKHGGADAHGHLGFIAGIVSRERAFAFERMLWRISRGNIYLKRADLDEPLIDPRTGNSLYKTVFVVFFQGQQLHGRIKKICNGFHASLYPCPSLHTERLEMLMGVRTRLEDLTSVIGQTEDHRRVVLLTIAKAIPSWSIMVTKMKAVYHSLNMFSLDLTTNCLIGEGWVPTRDLHMVQRALEDSSAAVGSSVKSFVQVIETKKTPPTYNRTNKFTRGFQALIDAYGIANYREVNPALYTCITFPFLFAVMFGDLGHGFLLFLFALWMVICENSLSKKKGGEIWRIFFAGRYIILLLGLFSMYTGFIYNDIFSKSINVFGSKWRIHYNRTTTLTNPINQLNPSNDTIGVYPIGMDPIWQLAENKIIFMNSYKMKLSIIFGVLHMVFGICFSAENFVYFKKFAYIILEFVPQIIFLMVLFGYMCFMMFMKWVKYSPTTTFEPDSPGCAPSVLIYFINMVLFKATSTLPGCEMYMFSGQRLLETIFVLVALVCIPWLLLGKPLYIQFTRKIHAKHAQKLIDQGIEKTIGKVEDIAEVEAVEGKSVQVEVETAVVLGSDDDEEEEEPMSEIWIHQAIHTIEYMLSTISHTASYLRLWALSLAHAELSDVLWTMVLTIGLQFQGYAGSVGLYFIFWAWALLTIAIMLMMEGLSAFLHTLRLHWVEFMSKFYTGAGLAFVPFSFSAILTATEDD